MKNQKKYDIIYVIQTKNDNEATLIINKKTLWSFLKNNYKWNRSSGFIKSFIKEKKMFFASNEGKTQLFSQYTTLDGVLENFIIADNNLLIKIFCQMCNLEIISLNYTKEKEKNYHFSISLKTEEAK